MKNWRDGGKYPVVKYSDLMAMIDYGYAWSNSDISLIWRILISVAQAEVKFSEREGFLPPYYSFCEAVCELHELLLETDSTISWWNIPFMAIRVSVPKNWEIF